MSGIRTATYPSKMLILQKSSQPSQNYRTHTITLAYTSSKIYTINMLCISSKVMHNQTPYTLNLSFINHFSIGSNLSFHHLNTSNFKSNTKIMTLDFTHSTPSSSTTGLESLSTKLLDLTQHSNYCKLQLQTTIMTLDFTHSTPSSSTTGLESLSTKFLDSALEHSQFIFHSAFKQPLTNHQSHSKKPLATITQFFD